MVRQKAGEHFCELLKVLLCERWGEYVEALTAVCWTFNLLPFPPPNCETTFWTLHGSLLV